MARNDTPDKPGGNAPGNAAKSDGAGDLEDRRKALDAALSERSATEKQAARDRGTGGGAGFADALKLSSEFIAGVLVGAGLGYLIDRLAGTAPWGMIVFLLLGFAAGIVNVLRSAGLVAEPEKRTQPGSKPGDKEE